MVCCEQAAIERGGKLCTSFTGLWEEGLTLVQLDWGWLLLQLGEVADYLVGQRRPPKGFPSRVEGATELTAMLQVGLFLHPLQPHASPTSFTTSRSSKLLVSATCVRVPPPPPHCW